MCVQCTRNLTIALVRFTRNFILPVVGIDRILRAKFVSRNYSAKLCKFATTIKISISYLTSTSNVTYTNHTILPHTLLYNTSILQF